MEGQKKNQGGQDLREENFSFEDPSGNSWPEKNYGCSFCNREFRSAQALGGHMNVHRRDRARLRSTLSLPSWLSDDNPKPNPSSPKPNPNLQYSSSSSASEVFTYAPYYPIHNNSPCLSLSSLSASTSEGKLPLPSPQSKETRMNKNIYARNAFGIEELKGFSKEDHEEKVCTNENGLELGLGIEFFEDPKEMIDLELRLGKS